MNQAIGTSPAPTEPTYDVVWPQSPSGVQAGCIAPRLDSLDGKRIAFLWDYLFRGDELYPILERELRAKFPDLQIVGYDEFGNSHGPDETRFIAELPEALTRHRVDAVVSAMGC